MGGIGTFNVQRSTFNFEVGTDASPKDCRAVKFRIRRLQDGQRTGNHHERSWFAVSEFNVEH